MSADWTPERIEALTGLWGQGLSAAEIGARLGITKNAVVGKVHRLNLPKRPSPIKRERPAGEGAVKAEAKPRARKTAPAKPAVEKKPAPVAAVAEVTPIKPAAKSTSTSVVTLNALKAGMCAWPEGDPGTEDFHFCGDQTVPGKPYCAHHCAKAYVKSSKGGGRVIEESKDDDDSEAEKTSEAA